eukprot:SAG11_NODE_6897_length_1229_cov_1.943363_3_plen_165_part_01
MTEENRNLHIVTGARENSENIDESNMQTSGQAGSISKTVSKQRENTTGCTEEDTDGKNEAYWAEQEQRLNADCDYPHEQILFSANRAKVAESPVHIDKMDYCVDPDFKVVYGILLKNKEHEERVEVHATQLDEQNSLYMTYIGGGAAPLSSVKTDDNLFLSHSDD